MKLFKPLMKQGKSSPFTITAMGIVSQTELMSHRIITVQAANTFSIEEDQYEPMLLL
jgi:hypothetical protein